MLSSLPNPPHELFTTQNLIGNISWHAISHEALTEPKIKTISFHADVSKRWQGEWIEWHLRHASPDDDDCVYGELLDDLHYESECSSSEGDEEDDDGDEGELLRCSDTDRPKQALPLVIETSNIECITINDYVSALHPWLMDLRQDITRADNMLGDRKPEEYEHLMLDITNPKYLSIMDEKRFLGYRYRGPPAQEPMSQEHAPVYITHPISISTFQSSNQSFHVSTMHFTSFLLAAATAVCLGPSFASAECTQFRNGRVKSKVTLR
ncbi:hypothetical protein CGGC5_v009480 [Colletotrichum fructicola Nara gc5]|uniref:Uncharacterized protein n=1 Tax=Colletotrichum fructicola (strain Nara gc5) TaxID=1213859 RepID=A0A7J6IZT8_COLFN|nr:hypothetical protein CGGC5_v009480 [Colletotrichum fructicola Nara gc5]